MSASTKEFCGDTFSPCGVGNGNPLQYSCLENSMDRGVWQAAVHGVTKKSDMTEHACTQPIRVSIEGRLGGREGRQVLERHVKMKGGSRFSGKQRRWITF